MSNIADGPLSKDLLTVELERYLSIDRADNKHKISITSKPCDRDIKLVSYYRNFIRHRVLNDKKKDIIDESVLKSLVDYLKSTSKLSYEIFKQISDIGEIPLGARQYFSAKVFLMFPRDECNCIDAFEFTSYLERSIDIEHAIINLMNAIPIGFDPLLTHVTEDQLQTYITKMIPKIDINQRMSEEFHEYYAVTATQKFIFFLDNRNSNTVPVRKVAHSKVMAELLQLCRDGMNNSSKRTRKQSQLNWFSCDKAVSLYELFVDLDKDKSGCLSMEEVMSFTGVSKAYPVNFTTLAYERLFNEYVPCQTGNEMDYKCFINFVLALENPTSEQSIKYFWKLLDLDYSGRLTPRKIKYFYEAIRSSLAGRYDTPSAEHIVVEVFDALGCNSEEGATLQDMIQSKQGQVVISLLLDVDGFWRYDNREHLNQMNSTAVEEEEEEEVAAEYYSSETFDEFELQDRL